MTALARRAALALLAAGALAACATVEQSSRDLLSEDQSSAVVARPLADVLAAVTVVLNGRGYALVEQRELGGGAAVYKFTGDRLALTVHRFGGPLGATHFGSSSARIGSAFFVRLAPRGASATEIYLLGKPTVDGAEVCTPYDLPSFGCRAVRVGGGWRSATTGSEEAETVRAVLGLLQRLGGSKS
jgi:hypothetical protein